jgi:hypothetical protein
VTAGAAPMRYMGDNHGLAPGWGSDMKDGREDAIACASAGLALAALAPLSDFVSTQRPIESETNAFGDH